MKTSLIVPLWNHMEDLTRPFVENVLKTKGDFELILVDNGSGDNTKQEIIKLAKKDKRIKCVFSETNLGFGGGNNLGYEQATGDTICFISNDVEILNTKWLLIFQELVSKDKLFVGPQLIDFNHLTDYNMEPTPYLGGWCVFGTREMFDKIAPTGKVWDPSFWIYFEDVWLSVMAVDAGYKLFEAPGMLNHMGSKSSGTVEITKETAKSLTVFRAKMLSRELKKTGQKRAVFVCAGVPYEFTDDDFEGKGVGGAEASLILLSRELIKKGIRVDIYNRTTVTGEFNGVNYFNINQFNYLEYCDLLVLFRAYHPAVKYANSRNKVFWSCDQYTDPEGIWNANILPYVNKVLAISPYHKNYLDKAYATENKVEVIDLGINWPDYEVEVEKNPGQCIFCSVPMRGLDILAKLLPAIKARVPEFNLVITSDYRLWGADADNEYYKKILASYDYVNYVGKIPHKEMVEFQKTSELMTYPCIYEECFCIAAMECMAAGATPVTSDYGALPTTVGEGGVILSNSNFEGNFVDSIVNLLENSARRKELQKIGRKIAKEHSWGTIVNKWLELINKGVSMEENTTVDNSIKALSSRTGLTTGEIKKACGIQNTEKNTLQLDESQVAVVLATAADKPVAQVFTAPVSDKMVIHTSVPVEFSINDGNYASKQIAADMHEVVVPTDCASTAADLIRMGYGKVII